MTIEPMTNVDRMLQNFVKRKKANEGKQIKNADLPAGSPMYYYCELCGASTAVTAESAPHRPPPLCEPCHELHKLGEI